MVDELRLRPPSLLKRLSVQGLHGYKDVEIDFTRNARVVIAENGSGKTTLLSILSLLINTQLYQLARFPFKSIELDLVGYEKTLKLDKADLGFDDVTEDIVKDISEHVEAPVSRIVNAVLDTHKSARTRQIVDQFYRNSPYSRIETSDIFRTARRALQNSIPKSAREISSSISTSFKDVSVLFLPTYRRIEVPLETQPERQGSVWTRQTNPARPWQLGPYVDRADIRFGLADVERLLRDLASDIQRLSNVGYREFSANIIDDLLDANTDAVEEASGDELPDLESLKLFLSRVDTEGTTDDRLQALNDLYDKSRQEKPHTRTLKYFLSKLAVVVEHTKVLESGIANFVEKVNSYLSLSSENKKMTYEASDMRVRVINSWTEQPVEMDDLSSGEKQVISLFAYLYLYKEPKFVLIDEPELSLSIKWQRRLLPDILETPNCVQLLAITHSPFVFDNLLNPVAGPMKIRRSDTVNG